LAHCDEKKKYIEGRKPYYFLSKPLSVITNQKIEYSKIKGLKKANYLDMITQTIDDHGQLNRAEINKLLWEILPSHLTNEQKNNLIHRYLSELREKGIIVNMGSKKYPVWERQ
jgi:ATP-dependent DNA helicase RecG